MAAILSATELEEHAQLQGVGILSHSTPQLDLLIQNMQMILEKKTGRVYDERRIYEKKLSFNGRAFATRYYPIKEITKICIYGVDEEDYDIDLDDGVIHLSYPAYELPIEIEYTTKTPEDVNLAKMVLASMVLDKISNRPSTVDDYITQLKRLTLRVI